MGLEIEAVSVRFGGLAALSEVSLGAAEGAITGLIGPNGAGKTTAFQCISGVARADAGTVRFAGQDVTGWRPDRITRAGMVRSFQIARGIPRLSVMENLMLYAPRQPGERVGTALAGGGRAEEEAVRAAAARVARRLGLLRLVNTPAASLSGGQKKLLEIGRALMAAPRMILLDEPVAGVNPTLAEEIAGHLRALRDALDFHMKPNAIVLLRAAVVPEGWSARFSATSRRYRYRILNRRARPALDAGHVWHVPFGLDEAAMHRAAQTLLGRHDFTSFRAAACQANSPLRTLTRLDVTRRGRGGRGGGRGAQLPAPSSPQSGRHAETGGRR